MTACSAFQKLLRFMRFHLFIVSLRPSALDVLFRKTSMPVHSVVFPSCSPFRFSVSGFMLPSLIDQFKAQLAFSSMVCSQDEDFSSRLCFSHFMCANHQVTSLRNTAGLMWVYLAQPLCWEMFLCKPRGFPQVRVEQVLVCLTFAFWVCFSIWNQSEENLGDSSDKTWSDWEETSRS